MTDPFAFPPVQAVGWICPWCGRVYAPNVSWCWSCNMNPVPPIPQPTRTGDSTGEKP